MNELSVYITNLGKYNEGEIVGAWFNLPVDFEEVKETIGLNDEYEEFAIHDYELPVKISEYTSINELNELASKLQELEGTPIYDCIDEIMNNWFNILDEIIEHQVDIICYSDCHSTEDLARYFIEELRLFGEISDKLEPYIDYMKLGRDLDIEGNYILSKNGVLEYN
ncbi:antirestriction protein ArdA [Mycoplasma sp. P36-A1]|uniref:antirestriction protein ArdA n=1 Tax=Mycoplasma sp. P36-A1 TaxID=3252900 RepID=UPI003C2BA165